MREAAHGAIGAELERERRVRHDEGRVDLEAGAETETDRARPEGRVEREVARRGVLEGDPVDGAGEVLGEREDLVCLDELDLGDSLAEPQRRLDRVGEPPLDAGAVDEPVDDDLDRVLLVAGEGVLLAPAELDEGPVDPGPGEPLRGELVEQRVVLALAGLDDGRQHVEAAPVRQVHHPVDDLLRALARDQPPAARAVRLADAGVEQPQVVVDLGDRADGRTGVARGGLLVDRDRGREPLDEVDVGLVHLAEELARVRRERLDVAPLALGVDGVEGERGLARPREPGEDDQPIARQFQRDVLQVVLAGPADDEGVGHLRRIRPSRLL